MTGRHEVAWMFRFALCAASEKQVPSDEAEQLLEDIIDWVEERDLQVGGGFRAERRTEADPVRPPSHRRWIFRFGLESSDEDDLAETAAAELLSHIQA